MNNTLPEIKQRRASPLARAALFIFYALAAAVIFNYLRKVDPQSFLNLSINWGLLSAAVAVSVISRFAFSNTFILILSGFSPDRSKWVLGNNAYARSWIGRYLPGKVAGLLARMYFFSPLGASHSAVAVASVLEVALCLFSGAVLGVAGLALAGSLDLDPSLHQVAFPAALVSLLLVSPPVINLVLKMILRVTGRAHLAEGLRVGTRTTVIGFLGVVTEMLICGAMYWLLAASLHQGIQLGHYFLLTGAFSLAGALGLAAFFTPAGLGVRELVVLPFLTKIMPAEASLAMIGLVRLIELLADIIYWLLSVWMAKTFGPGQRVADG
ncbi:hypothetical protein EPN95_04800 [Patescibacteria group bacterium]|nr:MAG: hypothetical protein EPN95_04800 [Patescibacteria group bacterium]